MDAPAVKKPRPPRLPKKIEVGSYEFTLQIVKPDFPKLEGADGISIFNFDDDGVYAIFLCARMGPKRTLDRFFHEVTHVINWINEIDDEDPESPIKEEEIATKHGAAWAQFWIDNPKALVWVNYMTARLHKDRANA